MRPQFHKLPLSSGSSFLFQTWECDYFDKPWHFHKEYELVLIEDSEGTRFIGDKVANFGSGTLVLIGPNIPHLFRNDERYYENKGLKAKSIFIHFSDDFLGARFFDVPEMQLVRNLLDKSALGIEIVGEACVYTRERLIDMQEVPPARRLLLLLDILSYLSTSGDLHYILSNAFTANNSKDTDRIDTVLQFIMQKYTDEIYVEEIASKLNMSVASFSRYFRHHTRKTFSHYITEIRIGHACRLLMEDNHNVSEICYLCGFDNLSNFYRHFTALLGTSPNKYKHRFLKR